MAKLAKDAGDTANLSVWEKNGNLFRECWALLSSHTTIQLLLLESVMHQATSATCLHMFHESLRVLLHSDGAKAFVTSNFFMTVNIVACTVQMLVMPKLLSGRNMPYVLLFIPAVCAAACLAGTVFGDHVSPLVASLAPFGALKVVEYAINTSAMQIVYMKIPDTQRYLGKELVRLLGTKLGKFTSQQVCVLLCYCSSFFSCF
jgi:hypothetical protein